MRALVLIAVLLICGPVYAAEEMMPITVRILDCSTYEKAARHCRDEGKCCEIAERLR